MDNSDNKEPLRFERKFLIRELLYKDVEQILKFHPSSFTEIFHQRIVNNIYFETMGLLHYYENVEGARDRSKMRIRWYGNTFGPVERPVLEYKIKSGLLGKKQSYPLGSFILDGKFDRSTIERLIPDNVPLKVRHELLSLQPVLLNSYTRRYFLSACKNFRVTIDQNLNYYKINAFRNNFLVKASDKASIIVELKYDKEREEEAKAVGSAFPFAMTKNSKYQQGMEKIFI